MEKEFNCEPQPPDPMARFLSAVQEFGAAVGRDIQVKGALDMHALLVDVLLARLSIRTLVELLARHGSLQLPECMDKLDELLRAPTLAPSP